MSVGQGLRKFKVALVQLAVGAQKSANLERAGSLVRTAAKEGAKLVALPECFNSPYGVKYFSDYAEAIPEGQSSQFLSGLAKECDIYLVGGSIPETAGGKLYNTCTVFGPGGNLLGKYRKMHLFDIDIPGGIRFQESEVLSPGEDYFTFNTGCHLLLYPGAFNMVTGPLHWELLARARAVDNQCYVAAISPARDDQAGYVAYGHTLFVNPWAKVEGSSEEKENIVYGEIDLDKVDDVRKNIPISRQKRLEVYTPAQANK